MSCSDTLSYTTLDVWLNRTVEVINSVFDLIRLRTMQIHLPEHVFASFRQFDFDRNMRFLYFIGELRTVFDHVVEYPDHLISEFSGFVQYLDLSYPGGTEAIWKILILTDEIVEQFFSGIGDRVR